MRPRTRVIAALDVTDGDRAWQIAEGLAGSVDALKVNHPLALAAGLPFVKRLASLAPVICDFKVADIPYTNQLIVEQVFAAGASGVIVHGFVGEDSVHACVDAAAGGAVYVVAEMSHPGAETFLQGAGESLAALAVRAGAAGIIAPATRPARIRALRAIVGGKTILAPGVGAQGGSAAAAVAAGADYVIAGRIIYDAPDPKTAAQAIAREIESGVRP